jgi:hypothetical protein
MMRSLFLLMAIIAANAFVILPHGSYQNSKRRAADDEILFGGEAISSVKDQQDLFASLKARQEALEQAIGKRYRVRTQKGFLNVHASYQDGPYAIDNIVNQLEDGEIVTSTGSCIDDWIPHDAGGWSIAVFGGFTWLEPLDDEL